MLGSTFPPRGQRTLTVFCGQVRCAAEDVVTAVEEGAEPAELRQLCDALMRAAKAADGWR